MLFTTQSLALFGFALLGLSMALWRTAQAIASKKQARPAPLGSSAAATAGAVQSLNSNTSQTGAGGILVLQADEKLRPAEIAYLIREGDLSHAILVMAVDLLQRAVKEQQLNSTMPKLAEYEAGMWKIALDNVKHWAIQKADIPTTLTSAMKVDPNKLLERATTVLRFFTVTLRAFIEKVVQDPRHIRKYISVAGVMRLVADFISAGYQRALEEELKKSLLRRGLLMPEKDRMACARVYLAFLGLILLFVFAIEIGFGMPVLQALLFLLLGLIVSITVRVTFHLRHYLPYYMDAIKLVERISREGVRLKLIRFVLNSLRTVTIVAAGLLFTTLFLFSFLIVKLLFPASNQLDFFALFLVAFALYFCADLLVKAWQWMYEERATPQAAQQIDHVRKKIERISPLETMKNMLQTPEYDETFSELLSIYGIEALVILM